MPMTQADIVDLAVEYSQVWMDIWNLFIAVIAAVVVAVTTLKKRLPLYAPLLVIGFSIFSIMHGVTIYRHYQVVWQIEIVLTTMDDVKPSVVELVQTMAPYAWEGVAIGYVLSVIIGLVTITRAGATKPVRDVLHITMDEPLLAEEGLDLDTDRAGTKWLVVVTALILQFLVLSLIVWGF